MAPGRMHTRHRRNPRRLRPGIGLGEHLEQRVVLSDFGGDPLGSALNAIGVVTGPVLAPSSSTSSGSSGTTSRLRTDLQTLQTDLANVASSSKLTVADLTSLASDSRAILQQATSRIDVKALDTGVSELATALTTSGGSTTTAVSDITSALSSAGVSSATITQTITDLTTAINDSGVTSAELTKIAADQSAIETDLSNLSSGGFDGGRWFGGDGRFGGPLGAIDGEAGGLLASSLTFNGVVTTPLLAPSSAPQGPWDGGNSGTGPTSQLRTDIQTLQTDLADLASTSKVTVSDLTSLASDSRAILQQATSRIDLTSLNKGIGELATALTASGGSTTTAVSDITSALSSAGVSSATITQTITDLTTAINDSGVTTTQLTKIAADQAAIQTDLSNLKANGDGDGDRDDGTGSSSGSSSSSGSGTNSPTSTPVTTTGGGSTSAPALISATAGADASTTTTDSTGGGSTTIGSTTRHKAAHKAAHFVHTAAKTHAAKPLAKFHRHG